MKLVVLFFGCYIFLTIIMCGIASMINSKFIHNFTTALWWSFPFICVLTALVMISLL